MSASRRLDRRLQRLYPLQDVGEVARGEVGDREEGPDVLASVDRGSRQRFPARAVHPLIFPRAPKTRARCGLVSHARPVRACASALCSAPMALPGRRLGTEVVRVGPRVRRRSSVPLLLGPRALHELLHPVVHLVEGVCELVTSGRCTSSGPWGGRGRPSPRTSSSGDLVSPILITALASEMSGTLLRRSSTAPRNLVLAVPASNGSSGRPDDIHGDRALRRLLARTLESRDR